MLKVAEQRPAGVPRRTLMVGAETVAVAQAVGLLVVTVSSLEVPSLRTVAASFAGPWWQARSRVSLSRSRERAILPQGWRCSRRRWWA
jgi:hypothetical protein